MSPVWTWRCPRCNRLQDWTMKTLEEADAAQKWCDNPDCYKNPLPMIRQFPFANFVLKGDGFYVNDYPKD